MFSRVHQKGALEADGHFVEAQPDEMTLRFIFKDPNRVREGRPIVDVSAPYNALDETHKVRRWGMAKGVTSFWSLAEVSGVQDEYPYAMSHHSQEISAYWHFIIFGFWVQHSLGRQIMGNWPSSSPRFRFATNMWWAINATRMNLALFVGVWGYFYSYEFLYRYVPGFKIRDPSLNEWKKPWEEGQSTFLARIAASVFPALGYILWAGRRKRAMATFACVTAASLQYEYARKNILCGNRMFFNFLAAKDLRNEAQWGSLAGDLRKKTDPDTNKTLEASQFRYVRHTTGMLQDTIWENATHDTLPATARSKKIPNPYFNWMKAPQNYLESPIRVKNDLWEMPTVLDSRMRSGVLDAR